mgnify:CR=1 FL=1
MPSITQKNDAYLARTKKSLETERNYYQEKKDVIKKQDDKINSKNEERIARQSSILDRTSSYSEFWIYNMGDRAKKIVTCFHEKKEIKDPLHVNVFDKSSGTMIKMKVSNILPNLNEDLDSYHVNRFGQVRFDENLYLASQILFFLVKHLNYYQNSSEC